jgi:hypothetical protein
MAIVPAPRPAAQLVVVAARTRSFLASEPAPLSHALEGETTAEGQEAGHPFCRPRGVKTEGERTIVCHLLVSKVSAVLAQHSFVRPSDLTRSALFPNRPLQWTGIQIQRKTFDLDHAFGPEHTNEDVYRALFNERKVRAQHLLSSKAGHLPRPMARSTSPLFLIQKTADELSSRRVADDRTIFI